VPYADPRYPDVFGRVQIGVVKPAANGQSVETNQVAPTILRLLGLDPASLQAVQQEGTPVLPGLG
jgi:hypothetical protein